MWCWEGYPPSAYIRLSFGCERAGPNTSCYSCCCSGAHQSGVSLCMTYLSLPQATHDRAVICRPVSTFPPSPPHHPTVCNYLSSIYVYHISSLRCASSKSAQCHLNGTQVPNVRQQREARLKLGRHKVCILVFVLRTGLLDQQLQKVSMLGPLLCVVYSLVSFHCLVGTTEAFNMSSMLHESKALEQRQVCNVHAFFQFVLV